MIIPLKTVSTMNLREHWSIRAKRAKAHRRETFWALASELKKPSLPCTITLTRIGKRKLDTDNLAASFKACRDGVADWLGIDDGDERLTWVYAQELGAYSVKIEIQDVSVQPTEIPPN